MKFFSGLANYSSSLTLSKLRTQYDRIKSHFIGAAREWLPELFGIRGETDQQRLACVESVLKDNRYLLPEDERREGGVSPGLFHHTMRVYANAALAATILSEPGDCEVYIRKVLPEVVHAWEICGRFLQFHGVG